MPNWKIHLEVANRLNSKIKYSGLKEEEFMFGNILPDINTLSDMHNKMRCQSDHKTKPQCVQHFTRKEKRQ